MTRTGTRIKTEYKSKEDTISALEDDTSFDHLTHDAAHRPDIHWQNNQIWIQLYVVLSTDFQEHCGQKQFYHSPYISFPRWPLVLCSIWLRRRVSS